ncbi:MAG: VWA domain-containing protein [Ignavibacteriaceae bacterium]|jgi:Ca-activated chloride channel family protein|nr:VWA domain-containing protein [Ignavibacteriaceae bacterium]
MGDVTFAYPIFLYLLILIPLLSYFYWKKNRYLFTELKYSSFDLFGEAKESIKERMAHLPFILRMIALSLFLIAMARPQSFSSGENVYTEGIDIAMVLDISGSMLAEDFKPNRLEAAKNVIDKFVKGRTSDKIGLVIFAGESFTQVPLTIDYMVLRNLLKEVYSGMVEDGTAIGNAIANGVNRLKTSKAKSKVMILLTDGVNNSGEIDPMTAAQIAQKFGIRIYTVGVGSMGQAPYPFNTPFGRRYQMVPVEIDENLLKNISKQTGGNYFRATGNKSLENIYNEIDRLEKTRVEVTSYRKAAELFYNWVWAGFFFLLLEFFITKLYLRKMP